QQLRKRPRLRLLGTGQIEGILAPVTPVRQRSVIAERPRADEGEQVELLPVAQAQTHEVGVAAAVGPRPRLVRAVLVAEGDRLPPAQGGCASPAAGTTGNAGEWSPAPFPGPRRPAGRASPGSRCGFASLCKRSASPPPCGCAVRQTERGRTPS